MCYCTVALKTGEKKPPGDICSLFCAGPGSKRLGIDGDREAIPLTLQIAYSKVSTWGLHSTHVAQIHLSAVSAGG